MKPKVVVADELTSDIDPVNAENIERLLVNFRDEKGQSVVVSAHDMDLAARIADRLYILRKGSIIAEEGPNDIFYDDAVLKDARLKPLEPVVFHKSLFEEGILKGGLRPIRRDEVGSLFKRMETIGISEKPISH
jgi:cobalt/nickel transport system ATP-binding protein